MVDLIELTDAWNALGEMVFGVAFLLILAQDVLGSYCITTRAD